MPQIQLRCSYCQNPFTLRRDEVLVALQKMKLENLHHFDAHCTRCRRANSIARERMERAYPGWQTELKELEKQAAETEKKPTVPAQPVEIKKVPGKNLKPATKAPAKVQKPVTAKKPAATAKPAAKKASGTVKKK